MAPPPDPNSKPRIRVAPASTRSQWSPPDPNRSQCSPPDPNSKPQDQSVRRRTPTASSRSQWSPPDLNSNRRMKVIPARPRPQRISEDISNRMPQRIPERMPERVSDRTEGITRKKGNFERACCTLFILTSPASSLHTKSRMLQSVKFAPHQCAAPLGVHLPDSTTRACTHGIKTGMCSKWQ